MTRRGHPRLGHVNKLVTIELSAYLVNSRICTMTRAMRISRYMTGRAATGLSPTSERYQAPT